MLADDLKEMLRQAEPHIETIKNYWNNAQSEKQFALLETESNQEEFWKHPQQTEISRKLQHLRALREQYLHILQATQELSELVDLFNNEEQELLKIKKDVTQLTKSINTFKLELLLNDPNSTAACFLSINAGAGGTESQDWANMLLRMYIRFCEREKLNASIIDHQSADEAGIKSATLFIKGKNAYGLLKSEHGIHRLVRISPFDASKRRHTSFAGIMVMPEMPDLDVSIDPSDLRIDTYRSSGAGGQHVNVTDSAVRITHLPTNIVVQCQNERSQLQNKETAMRMLRAKLAQKLTEDRKEEIKAGTEKKKIEWGSQIRSYVLHPYKMVKDHRTNYESFQPDLVLDGELTDFIESYLVWKSSNHA